MKIFDHGVRKNKNLWTQDKGQNACVKAFTKSIENNLVSPIPIEEIFEVSDVTLKLADALYES